jgi:hypothetical protein
MNLHSDDPSAEKTGVRRCAPTAFVHRLTARWNDALARHEPSSPELRALVAEISGALDTVSARIVELEHEALTPSSVAELDLLLEAVSLLDRLHWCTLHNAPYVDRPRLSSRSR